MGRFELWIGRRERKDTAVALWYVIVAFGSLGTAGIPVTPASMPFMNSGTLCPMECEYYNSTS